MRFQSQIFILIFTLLGAAQAQQPEPVMDYATLLTSVDVRPDGRLRLENDNEPLTTVFLPDSANVVAVVTKAGSQTPLHTQDFYRTRGNKVFSFLQTRGKYKEFKFTEPGDYVVSFKSGNKVLTRLPFTLVRKSNNDEFDPITFWHTQGPWQDMAYIHYLRGGGDEANVEFRMWGQRAEFDSTGTNADQYDVILKKDGDVVAEARTGHVGTPYWLRLTFQMRNPDSKGGRMYTIKELTSRDGTYQFVVSKNNQLYAVYPLEVRGGKPVLHPRQASNFQPRQQYIVPRYSNMHAGINDIGDTFWMTKMTAAEANSAASGKAAEVAGPTEEQRKRWNWLPLSVDPNRGFKFHVTDIETRTDTGFDVGEDLVVFGVGHPTGVKYMKAGDAAAQEIPEGETWSSKVFAVCGTKIVLSKKNQVAVFDTKTGDLVKIPTTKISLYNPSSRLMHANGFLVATVNKATDVTDRNIIKIIDVSQDEPVIIPIKNSNYTHDQVSSVDLDAKEGIVAISSRAKKQISAAKIAPLANQHNFDVSEYRGVADFQITLEDEVVTYADEDWKVRQLQLGETPRAITQEPIARSGNGFWVRKSRLVATTKTDKVGSRYPMMITDSDSAPRLVPGTGTDIMGTSAKLGLAGSAAIAIDKTVFLAGTPGDSIGTGERLQMLTDEGWTPIIGQDGKPVWGSQVVTSMGFMALKVRNTDGKTVIGYATYGERISKPSTSSRPVTSSKPNMATGKLKFANDNPYNTNDEKSGGKLQAYLDSDKEIAEAYVPAFGKEEAYKKIVESALKAMKTNGDEALIDAYMRVSPYVNDKDRPATASGDSNSQSNVAMDPVAVNQYLTGQWKALRFSTQGNDLPDEAIENLKLAFSNQKYVMNMGSEVQTGSYSIDTSTSPMSMTINIGSGQYKGQTRKGSFKLLESKRLLMVFATDEQGHPTRFVPDSSGKTIMAVYTK